MKKIIGKLKPFVKSNIFNKAAALTLIVMLSGCGEQKPDVVTEAYRNDMTQFCNTVNSLSQDINSIDPNAENASAIFLNDLDQMKTAFQNMSQLTVPEEYSEAGTLAYEAAAYMNDAVSLYHDAYGENGYDENFATQAQSQYQNAMDRISSIGQYFKEH
ncbi:MAG: hypothetical protein IKO10_15675 [Lachnospiraceae bacterium]|nr:hypothetical protein [Lachnospiraceae bacterium]